MPFLLCGASSNIEIPKIIWSYWDGSNEFVDVCVKSWRLSNPDYQINMLNSSTIGNYINMSYDLGKFGIAGKTDYYRLQLIYTYGGFWIDATTFVNKPLSWIVVPDDIFYLIKDIPYKQIYSWESYLLAGPAGSKSFKLLLDEFSLFMSNQRRYPKFSPYGQIVLGLSNDYHFIYRVHFFATLKHQHLRDQNMKLRTNRKETYIMGGKFENLARCLIDHHFDYYDRNIPSKYVDQMKMFKLIHDNRENYKHTKCDGNKMQSSWKTYHKISSAW